MVSKLSSKVSPGGKNIANQNYGEIVSYPSSQRGKLSISSQGFDWSEVLSNNFIQLNRTSFISAVLRPPGGREVSSKP